MLSSSRCLALAVIALAPSIATAQVAAVMYHAHPNLGHDVNDFRDHMEFLVENGFNTITMDEFYDWHQHDAALPLRPIIITVDDNYIAGYTEMYPIFVELGIVAINYLHTEGIGIGAPKASWAQVREMDEAGVFLAESHSRTHPRLSTITPTQLFSEVHGSRDDIAENLDGKVSLHFCYPYGDYNQAVIDELIAAGYITGITTNRGLNYRNTPLFELERWWGDGKDLGEFLVEIRYQDYNPLPEVGWIIDDAEPGFYYNASEWWASTSISGYFGSGYRVHDPNGAEQSPRVRFAAVLPETGDMQVFARWTEASNRTAAATYTIRTASGDVPVTVDQRANGGEWFDLGVHEFAEGEPVEVFLEGEGDGVLIADAIWFVPWEQPASDLWLLTE